MAEEVEGCIGIPALEVDGSGIIALDEDGAPTIMLEDLELERVDEIGDGTADPPPSRIAPQIPLL